MCREPADKPLAFGILRENAFAGWMRGLLHIVKDLLGSSN
jgi:hypothetical protein